MENETNNLKESVSKNENKHESDTKNLSLDDKQIDNNKFSDDKVKSSQTNLILRVYNVPPEYTSTKLKELIIENCSTAQLSEIIPPYPWEDLIDTCWIVICSNRKTYTSLLSLEDIWIKPDKNDKYGSSLTFVPGDEMDLHNFPSESDEQYILNDHLKNSVN